MRLSGRKPTSYARPFWTQQYRFALLVLIAANGVAFIGQLLLDAYDSGFVRTFLALSGDGVQDAYAWQFLTSAFLHQGPWHLAANTVVLYFFGRDVECIVGQRQFLGLYLLGAIGGEMGHLFLMPSSTILLGASGGVAAVVLAYTTILPELEVAAPRLFGRRWPLKAKHLGSTFIFVSVVLLLIQRDGAVAHSAFLGGGAAGWLYAHLLGFGRVSIVQRTLSQRRLTAERHQNMEVSQFITQEVDPLLEKVARSGLKSLTRNERRILALAGEKLGRKA